MHAFALYMTHQIFEVHPFLFHVIIHFLPPLFFPGIIEGTNASAFATAATTVVEAAKFTLEAVKLTLSAPGGCKSGIISTPEAEKMALSAP